MTIEIKVKPLEWENPTRLSNGCYAAKTFFGDYYVAQQDGLWYAGNEEIRFDWECEYDTNTLDAAKAAAEADYQKRILSCILITETNEEKDC